VAGRPRACAELWKAAALERQLEARRVVTAVVSRRTAVLEGQSHVPRKLVGLDEVAPPDFARLKAELARDPPDHAFHDEGAVRPPRATVGRHHHLVRVADLEFDGIVAKSVRPRELRRGDEGDDDAVRRVRAGVVEEPVAQGEDPAGLVGRHLDLVELSALLARAREVLRAVFDPDRKSTRLNSSHVSSSY